MSTWISKLSLILAVAGCVAPGGTASGPGRMELLGGAITAAVPPSYCLDPKSRHAQQSGTVVIGGRCSTGSPVPAAAITISIGGEGSSEVLTSGARVLTEWVRSPAGRAAIARDGRAGSVNIRETLVADGAFLIRLEDRSIGSYWRAAIGVKGRLVMISVTPPEGGTLGSDDARKIVGDVVAAMRRANPTS